MAVYCEIISESINTEISMSYECKYEYKNTMSYEAPIIILTNRNKYGSISCAKAYTNIRQPMT